MNYLLYVLAAYTITFVLIAVMFVGSYRKYKKAKAKLETPAQNFETVES